MITDKLKEQLPHKLRGNYSECPGGVVEVRELVHLVQSELFPGLSEPCITSLVTETIPEVYPRAKIENDLQLTCRY